MVESRNYAELVRLLADLDLDATEQRRVIAILVGVLSAHDAYGAATMLRHIADKLLTAPSRLDG